MERIGWLRRRGLRTAIAAGLLFVVGACQDSGSVTDPMPTPNAALVPGSGGTPVDVLRRTVMLESDEQASGRMGVLGTTLRLPRSGLTVIVPPLAAPIGTTIRVYAPKGNLVGYYFEPHGITFRLPVVMIQDLGRTEARGTLLSLLVGAYFEGSLEPTVRALELLPVELRVGVLNQAVITLRHFSGYVVATNGRAPSGRSFR
jgi:hypothetical protein